MHAVLNLVALVKPSSNPYIKLGRVIPLVICASYLTH